MAQDMTIGIEIKAFDQFGKVTQKFNSQLKTMGKTAKTTKTSMDKMKASASKLNTTFNRLAIVGFGALTLGMRKVIMVGAEFEQSIANLSALTGLGAKDMGSLSKAALEMGKAYGISSSEVADGMTKVGSNMPVLLKQPKALQAVTDASLKMARISGMTVPEAATALTSSMNAMGLASKDSAKNIKYANEMLDSMAALAKAGPSPINEQALAMRESAAVANKMGLTFQNLGGMIQMVAEKNIRGARSGRMLRNILLTIDKESDGRVKNYKDLTDWIGKYGENINTTGDLLKEFTKRDIVATLALMENKGALEEYAQASKKIGVANEQLAKTMATTNMQWKMFKATVQSFAIKVFQKHLQEPIKSLLKTMARFVEWLDSGSAGARIFLSVLSGFGALLASIGTAFVAIKMGMFIKEVYLMTTAFLGLGTSLTVATGGLSLIIPVLAGVATWFFTAGRDAEQAGDKISKFGDTKTQLDTFNKALDKNKDAWDAIASSIGLVLENSDKYANSQKSEEQKAKAFVERFKVDGKNLRAQSLTGQATDIFGGTAIDFANLVLTKSRIGDAMTRGDKSSEANLRLKEQKIGASIRDRENRLSRGKLANRLIEEAMENMKKYGTYGTAQTIDGKTQLVVNITNENGMTKNVSTEGEVDAQVNTRLSVGTQSGAEL